MNIHGRHFRTLWLKPDDPEVVQIIDQRHLPFALVIEDLRTVAEVAVAIREMHARGAGLIGALAGYGLYLAALEARAMPASAFMAHVTASGAILKATRPTAVNLEWAVARQLAAVATVDGPNDARVATARRVAAEIADEDAAYCKQIGDHGLALIEAIAARKPGQLVNVLTHCNAGWLAFVDYGTATAPIYAAHDRGIPVHVWVDETRPRNQGARLTVYELSQAGIDVTLIADSMAATVMKNGWVQAVLVGCDRVAANGDTANKIGTLGVAILAQRFGIPFYVCAPTSTIDLACPDGAAIPIELRKPEELKRMWYARPMAPDNVPAYNPAFDVTDHDLITAIITEHGVARAPFIDSLPPLVRR